MYELVNQINRAKKEQDLETASQLVSDLRGFGEVLGVLQSDADNFLQAAASDEISADQVEQLIADRAQAKLDKNYARADEIRQNLAEQGIQLDDSREGTTWRRV